MSKSSGSIRHSSPRAMPVETIITRFKSAQQKRQLREMDRSMTKVTELLKNPLKPKNKKKLPLKKVPSTNSVSPVKDVEERKRTRKNKQKNTERVESEEEFCPLNLKRHIVLNKIRLKPKHDLKIIAQTNKRKRSVPQRGLITKDNTELPMDCELSRDSSPKAKKIRSVPQDMTMEEMIQLIEDSGSLNDEDLLEILTCPSPVWWEDPPDGYIEDALFTRPKSTAEMYPSIRSQLEENLQERQRSSTPNILSRRDRGNGRTISNNNDVKKNDKEESSDNRDDIDLEITLSKCDEKFIRKRSKLESVLGNLKNKTIKNVKPANKISNDVEIVDVCRASNKVSVIKNLCSDVVTKSDGNVENSQSNKESNTDKGKQTEGSMETDHDSTDDERLTDISFHDDAYLDDLENMDIPIQDADLSMKKQQVKEKISENLTLIPEVNTEIPEVNTDDFTEAAVPDFKEQKGLSNAADKCIISEFSSSKCKTFNFKSHSVDPTYSDKESSIIEDYFEMKLFEEDDGSVGKKHNVGSKVDSNTFPVTTVKSKNELKNNESNLTTSVIKFKNSDNTSINVFKIEGVVPKNLPPLKNSDKRKGNMGRVPENLPPLKRNPGVIQLNSESPKSVNSTTSCDTTDSCNSVSVQDNIDSISDTNICFLIEDEDDSCNEKKIEDSNDVDGTVSTGNKSRSIIRTNEFHTRNNVLPKNDIKCTDDVVPTDNFRFARDVDIYRDFKKINGVIADEFNKLEFQSLTITKVNDNNCCSEVENKLDSVIIKKNDVNLMNCKKEEYTNDELAHAMTNELSTIESKPCIDEFTSRIHDDIIKVEKDNSECITVYKIVSDDSGNEEPKNELPTDTSKSKVKNKDLLNVFNSKESNLDFKSDDSMEKPDSNRDKMIFYFKKCKNLHWKHKNSEQTEDKKPGVKIEDFCVNNTEIIGTGNTKDNIDDFISLKINSTGSLEENTETEYEDNKNEIISEVNHNNNVTNADQNEQKCIIVSNTKQIRYCMKCSSIFDTAQCNYCFRKNSADSKNPTDTEHLSKMEHCFICDVCRYKALSKDSLERHILNHCCDSKHR